MAKDTTIAILLHLRDQIPDFQTYLNQITIEAQTIGATHLIIVDQTKFHIARYFETDKINVALFDTLEDAEEEYSNLNKMYLEPQRAHHQLTSTPLPELTHPDNALYITGPDAGTIPTKDREDSTWVHIPMAAENGVYYATTALVLALYDRLVKHQNNSSVK